MPTIEFDLNRDGIASLTLSRDRKRNAINQAMAEELLDGMNSAERQGARVVVIRARPGVAVWCAGHDLGELDPRDLHRENPTLAVVRRMQTISLPVLAMVEGKVFAGGMIMLLAADIVIAAENADVAITSNKLGIPLPIEMYAFALRVLGLHKLKELLFTAAPITARDACRAGLYNHVVAREQLESTTYEIARKILAATPDALANTKHQLNLLATQTALSPAQLADIGKENDDLLNHPDTRARIASLLDKVRGPGPVNE